MYVRNKRLPQIGGTSRYLVTGFDGGGNELFSVKAEGISDPDAKLSALRNLRMTPEGWQKANAAKKIVAELLWRNVNG